MARNGNSVAKLRRVRNNPLKMHKKRGFSLVELVIAIALGAFFLTSGYYAFSAIFRNTTEQSLQSKADEKLRNIMEQIRYQAVNEFETMNDINVDRTGDTDPQIRIISNIGPISPTDKTRPVTLRSEYFLPRSGGPVLVVSTRTFQLANVYGKALGGAIKVKVVKASNITDGISNIRVTVPGEGTPSVVGTTGGNGECTVYGVKLNQTNLQITLNGTLSRVYFIPDPGNVPAFPNNNFVKDTQPDTPGQVTQTGVTIDYGTHLAVVPGSVSGVVKDVTVPGVMGGRNGIRVRLVPAGAPVDYHLVVDDRETVTQTYTPGGGALVLGHYEFKKVVPGKYYLYVLGGGSDPVIKYAAADYPGTKAISPDWSANSGFPASWFINVSEGVDTPVNKVVVQKGVLEGFVRRATPGAWEPNVLNQELSGETPIVFFPVNERLSYFHPTSAQFDWSNSQTDQDLLPNLIGLPQVQRYEAMSDGAGFLSNSLVNSTIRFVSPYVVHADTTTYPMVNQGQILNVEPGQFISLDPVFDSRVVPALIHRDSGSGAYSMVVRHPGNSAPLLLPTTVDPNIIADRFGVRLYANGNNSPTTLPEYFYIKRDNNLLSRANGTIQVSPAAAAAGFQSHYVYANFSRAVPNSQDSGMGGLAFTGNAPNSLCYIEPGLTINTQIDAGDNTLHHFDFYSTVHNLNLLLPNIGTDTQAFRFYAIKNGHTDKPSDFTGVIHGFTKTYDGTNYAYVEIPPLTMDINGFEITASNNAHTFVVNPVDITNGGFSFNRDAQEVEQWAANLPAEHFSPGENHPYGLVPAAASPVARTYYLKASTTSTMANPDDWEWLAPTYFPGGAPYDGIVGNPNNQYFARYTEPEHNLRFVHRGLVTIKVQVLSPLGTPVSPVPVTVSGPGFTPIVQDTFLDGWASFHDLRFPLLPGDNIIIEVNVPGFNPVHKRYQGYEPQGPGDPPLGANVIRMPDIVEVITLTEPDDPPGNGGSG